MIYQMVRQWGTEMRRLVVLLAWQGFSPREMKRRNPDFAPSPRTIRRFIKEWSETGSFAPPSRVRRRRWDAMPEEHLTWLTSYLDDVDATLYLDEMQSKLIDEFGVRHGISTICSNLILRAKYTRKVLSRIAIRQNEFVREEWRDSMRDIESSRFIFLDETRKDPKTIKRRFGRGQIGTRVRYAAAFNRATRGYSALAFMTMDGVVAHTITSRRGFDRAAFQADLQEHLLPLLKPDSVVVLDNASIHHSPQIVNLIEGHCPGAMVVYLPTYSYDMNPIEMAFSKVKSWLERHGDEPQYKADPRYALRCALESVNADDACGYFSHCGYPCFKLPFTDTWVASSPSSAGAGGCLVS